MDLTSLVNIDELQQLECMICTVQYMDLTPPVNIDELQKWSMICIVQYMYLILPVNIDELQQVEYDMFCTVHVS